MFDHFQRHMYSDGKYFGTWEKNPVETLVICMKLRIHLSTTYHGLPAFS